MYMLHSDAKVTRINEQTAGVNDTKCRRRPISLVCIQKTAKSRFLLLKMLKPYVTLFAHNMWDKAFKSGPSKICGRQALKI